MYTKEQLEQIQDAKWLIPDDETVVIISNPNLSADHMQRLIVIACSHPLALVDQPNMSQAQIDQATVEIRKAVSDRAKQLLSNPEQSSRSPMEQVEVNGIER